MSELNPAKTALQRAHEINARQNAERLRLSNAINQAVALVAMLVLVAASFAYFGAPQMQHWVKANQEQVTHVSR